MQGTRRGQRGGKKSGRKSEVGGPESVRRPIMTRRALVAGLIHQVSDRGNPPFGEIHSLEKHTPIPRRVVSFHVGSPRCPVL